MMIVIKGKPIAFFIEERPAVRKKSPP